MLITILIAERYLLLKSKNYISGLFLVSLSFIAGVLSYYLIYLVIPVFLLGVIFIFGSDANIRIKLATVIAPLFLYFPIMHIVFSLYSKTDPVKFIIPADYEGQFCVVYGEKCGTSPIKIADTIILSIPDNGILILQAKYKPGIVSHQFYLKNKNGNSKKINEVYSLKDVNNHMPAILMGGTGSIGSSSPGGASSNETSITFTKFTVFNRDTLLSKSHKTEQLIDSLVSQCRLSIK